jgi:hypothetical protein
MEYPNHYSLIITFNFPIDEVVKYLKADQLWRIEAGQYETDYFSDYEIELIASLDEARILEHFISDYSIFHDGRGFTPAWIYWHDIEAYEAVGITPEMIEEKLHLYAEFSFTAEATLAFEAKLSEFLGREIILANEWIATTDDALEILRAVAGWFKLTDAQIARYGISGAPSTADAMRILRIVAGLI